MNIRWRAVLGVVGALVVLAPAVAQELHIPLPAYRTGPFAPGGSGMFGGLEDYLALMNATGGVSGMTFTWEECESAYDTSRGVECYERHKSKAFFWLPYCTGVTYAIAERAEKEKIPILTLAHGRPESVDGTTWPYLFPLVVNDWAGASAIVNYIAQKEGGPEKLKGKRIALLHMDVPYGRGPIAIMERLAREKGFQFRNFPLPVPSIEQSAAWVDIARRFKADYVLQWNWGVSCTVPYREMKKVGFPVDRLLSVWWCGSEEDVRPAGEAAIGAVQASFHAAGQDFPVMKAILEKVHKAGKGNLETERIGTMHHAKGVIHGIILAEAMRVAVEAKGKPINGEKMMYGLSHLDITTVRLRELGAEGLMPEIKTTPENHGGISPIKMLRWDGRRWNAFTDWIYPDEEAVLDLVKKTAAEVRAERAGKK